MHEAPAPLTVVCVQLTDSTGGYGQHDSSAIVAAIPGRAAYLSATTPDSGLVRQGLENIAQKIGLSRDAFEVRVLVAVVIGD
jgi:hypothetical protein